MSEEVLEPTGETPTVVQALSAALARVLLLLRDGPDVGHDGGKRLHDGRGLARGLEHGGNAGDTEDGEGA